MQWHSHGLWCKLASFGTGTSPSLSNFSKNIWLFLNLPQPFQLKLQPPPPTNVTRYVYVPPLTPPSSEPGSPGNAGVSRRTPPPPYQHQPSVTTRPIHANSNNHQQYVSSLSCNGNNTGNSMRPLTSCGPHGKRESNNNSVFTTQKTVSLHKYNRRNNPELEKRRIHHCDFVGK